MVQIPLLGKSSHLGKQNFDEVLLGCPCKLLMKKATIQMTTTRPRTHSTHMFKIQLGLILENIENLHTWL